MTEVVHAPVMLKEAVDLLNPHEGGIYVDCTLGGGGHAKEILSRVGETGYLIAFDKDQHAIKRSQKVLAPYLDRVTFAHRDYRFLTDVLQELKIDEVDGILFDLVFLHISFWKPRNGV